jgi:hypothetical protein
MHAVADELRRWTTVAPSHSPTRVGDGPAFCTMEQLVRPNTGPSVQETKVTPAFKTNWHTFPVHDGSRSAIGPRALNLPIRHGILVIWRSHAQTKIVMAHIPSLEFMAQIPGAYELGLQNASPGVIAHLLIEGFHPTICQLYDFFHGTWSRKSCEHEINQFYS